ncbi:hypothetical protein I7I51_08197 [Histoplasma capsulatum]|uniref:Uncharacterized protein n=1 Tax=Ajellomyces capsulatus TaxID=5037 RepID=A0A8A1LX78_AJECA|nr:hypothetical protein I7I51_08197 [Histoplasma capsulatum]
MTIGKEPCGICEESASTPSPSDIQTYKGFLASVAKAMKGRLSKLGKPVLGSVDWLRRANELLQIFKRMEEAEMERHYLWPYNITADLGAQMDGPKLRFGFYQPRLGDLKHAALYLDANDQDVVWEIIGLHPVFQHNIAYLRLKCPKDFVDKVFIAAISKNNM